MSKQPLLALFYFATGVLLALAVTSTSLAASSPNGLWADLSDAALQARNASQPVPKRYRALSLSLPDMQTVLSTAPIELSGQIGTSLYLPMPDGTFKEFLVEFSPVMAPELAAKFPQITTYRAVAVGDAATGGRLDFTPQGFHAMIFSPEGTVFIDPADQTTNTEYISYNKRDATPHEKPWQCLVESESHSSVPAQSRFDPSQALVPSGTQLRTYRTAVAATGEYTAFHGGTVAAGQAAIVTAINRVTGIYERDLAIRLVLVANNDQLVYTNPATDPYTNSNPSALLNENQANLDDVAVLGEANYDIGHVFSTGGGGLASLGVPCRSGLKARGETGLTNPIGDPFYVDFVAHEIGHQFGGNHTFNGSTSNCSGGNRNGSTAYETGSGSTIQAYAGICGAENIQNNSDDYFHTISFDEMIAYSTVGFGNDCPVITATGNSVPVPNAGSDFTIPIGTPFMLTGSATDADGGDVLTYTWEQFDLGAATSAPPWTDLGTGPLFRSFPPTTSPTRVFPQVSDIANGVSTLGELLPTTGRDLTFRMTVRDNALGGGGVDYDTAVVTTIDTGTGFDVTSQNSPTTWTDGAIETITWDVAGTTAAPISCPTVDIDFSDDAGVTFATNLATGTANDGSEDITVPNVLTTVGRVRVKCANNIFFDMNTANINLGFAQCSFEDFGAGPALPAGWTVFNDGPNVLDWGMTNDGVCGTLNWTAGNYTGGTGEAACVDSDAAGNGVVNAYLCSPQIDLSTATSSILSFLYNYQVFNAPTATDIFEVLVGTAVPSLANFGGYSSAFSTTSNQGALAALPGATETLDISMFDGTMPYVCFHYSGDFDWYAQVDDVSTNGINCGADPDDPDGDGVLTSAGDNCPNDPNPNQEDFDGDGVGYACDTTCASVIDFMYTFSNGEMFELLASDSIKFEGSMASGSDIIFDGANSVVLKNNTSIALGAQFRARSDGCM